MRRLLQSFGKNAPLFFAFFSVLSTVFLFLGSVKTFAADKTPPLQEDFLYQKMKTLTPPAFKSPLLSEETDPGQQPTQPQPLKQKQRQAPEQETEQDSTKPNITVGGYFDIYGGATRYKNVPSHGGKSRLSSSLSGGKSDTKNVHRGNFFFDGDLFIAIEQSFSDDFSIGARADGKLYLDAQNTPHARLRSDDAYLQLLSEKFGRLMIGKADNAGVLMHYSAPKISPLGVDNSSLNRFLYFTGRKARRHERPTYPISTSLNGEGNDLKVNYFTPELYGLTFGVSYITKGDSYNKNLYIFQTGASHKAGYLASVGYLNTFDGVSVGLSGATAFYEGKDTRQNRREYSIGSNISYQDFTIGGAGRLIEYDSNKATQADGYAFNFGVSYNNHLFGADLTYIQGVTKSKPYKESLKVWQTSFIWHYKPELDIFLTWAHQKYGLNEKTTGQSILSGVSYTF
jgi:hypothetical protein